MSDPDATTRSRLVESAARLFRQKGYNGTGLSEVLEAARAPKGSLYHHFPKGKADLALAAADWTSDVVLRVIDETTLAFADFAGNRQYITTGNLAENPRAMLFLMDYQQRRRVKIWGEARVVENDAGLNDRLMPQGYAARPEQAILFTVAAWDSNCPQHIPQRFEAADVAAALDARDRRIAELEAEIETLRAAAV